MTTQCQLCHPAAVAYLAQLGSPPWHDCLPDEVIEPFEGIVQIYREEQGND